VFLAGATGVLGIRILPLLVSEGHVVAGMTRSPGKSSDLEALGAESVVCDVFDGPALIAAVSTFSPDALMHQVTDLPDHIEKLPEFAARNDRVRTEGTRNLLAAARAAGVERFVAQSIAWRPPGRGDIVDEHEQVVLEFGGVVARYGQLYGPGTFYEADLPPPPRIQVDAAARATPRLLSVPPGIVVLTEDD
jgi:nucleoside-diphosphate-sugar epimerase